MADQEKLIEGEQSPEKIHKDLKDLAYDRLR